VSQAYFVFVFSFSFVFAGIVVGIIVLVGLVAFIIVRSAVRQKVCVDVQRACGVFTYCGVFI
jgi:hypothetical protein